jgi:hypothetical protein
MAHKKIIAVSGSDGNGFGNGEKTKVWYIVKKAMVDNSERRMK